MRIKLAPGFWLGLGALWLLDEEGYLPLLLVAAAAHEAGHLLALRALGARGLSLRLGFLDARIETGMISYRQEVLTALAGPAVSVLCGLAFARRASSFAAISLLLGAFNLLPVWPLDGGRALRAGLCLWLSPEGAKRAVLAVGLLTCALGFSGALWLSFACGAGLLPVLLCCGIFVRLAGYGRGEAIEA